MLLLCLKIERKSKEDDICMADSVKVIVTEETPIPDYDTYTVVAEPTTVSIENTKTAIIKFLTVMG